MASRAQLTCIRLETAYPVAAVAAANRPIPARILVAAVAAPIAMAAAAGAASMSKGWPPMAAADKAQARWAAQAAAEWRGRSRLSLNLQGAGPARAMADLQDPGLTQ
jgi:hypothetical protein